jgi:hypothetical protein
MKKYSTALSIGLIVLGIGALLLHFLWSDGEENSEFETDAAVNGAEDAGAANPDGEGGAEATGGEAYPSQGMPAQEAAGEGEAAAPAAGDTAGQPVKQEAAAVGQAGAAQPAGDSGDDAEE